MFKPRKAYAFLAFWRFSPSYLRILILYGSFESYSSGTLYAFPVFLSRAAITNFAEHAILYFP